MLFAAIQLLKWLVMMGAFIFCTWLLKKMKLSDRVRTVCNVAVILFAVVFFFIPFDEILTFRTSETAFNATVLGDELMEDEGEKTHGVFFRDKRGTYSTVFFYCENGRYHKCAAENRETVLTAESGGVYADLYRIAGTEDEYLLVRGFADGLTLSDNAGTVFKVDDLITGNGTLFFSMACVNYGEGYVLTVNGEVFPLS